MVPLYRSHITNLYSTTSVLTTTILEYAIGAGITAGLQNKSNFIISFFKLPFIKAETIFLSL